MKKERKYNDEHVKDKISMLWIMVMIIMAFADIFNFVMPGYVNDLAAGTTPIKITEPLMLGMALITTIPISMIFLNKVLSGKANKWVNSLAGVVTIAYVIVGGTAYLHYYYFAGLESICMLGIIWLSWRKAHLEINEGEYHES